MSNPSDDPLRDPARLAQLQASGLLDSPPDEGFDRLARLATRFLRVPVALVSLVDEDRQFFKSCVGLHEPWASDRQTPLTHSFCQHVVSTGEPLVIDDARADPRVVGNLAMTEIGVVAYLGIPITVDGKVLGSFCAIDDKPRAWTGDDVSAMEDLAKSVVSEVRLRIKSEEQAQLRRGAESARGEAEAARRNVEVIFASISDAVIATDGAGDVTFINPTACDLCGWSAGEAIGRPVEVVFNAVEERTGRKIDRFVENVLATGVRADWRDHTILIARDGRRREIEESAAPIIVEGRVVGAVLTFRNVAPRKRQAKLLEEARRRLDHALSAGSVATFSWDIPNDHFVGDANMASFYSIPPEERDGGPVSTYFLAIHPDDRDRVGRALGEAIATGESFEEQYRIVRAGEPDRWVVGRGGFKRDEQGRSVVMSGVILDITERKRAEETLRKSEERYRTLFDSMEEGFCILQVKFDETDTPIDYRFLEINPAFEHLVRSEGAVGRWVSEVFPDVTREWHERYGRVARSGESERFEMTEPSMDGRSFAVHAFPVGDPGEHKVAVLFDDITARRRAEDAIRQSEAQFRMIADNITQLAWTCDHLGNVTWYNRRWLDYTGMSFEAMKGWDWSKVQHPDHLDRVVARVSQSAESGEPWEDTFPLRGKDGRYRWFFSQAVPIRAEDGTILRWFGTNTDVTAQREAEQDLREADVRKNEFLAMLAHELRNPLGAISSGIRLAEADQDPGTLAEVRRIIQHQVGHLRHLIDDLLDVSRITQSKIELRKQTIELTAICRRAVELARPQVDEKRHRLALTTPGEATLFEADPTRVEQMLSNLLTNAAKYSEPERAIDLSASVEGDEVVFRVRDQGFGISAEMLPRIFGLFTQVDATLDRARGGLGIGLTLVKNLAEMHGGTITADSEGVDRGSLFTLRLPVGTPAATDTRIPATTDPTESHADSPPDRLRILIIDDNRDTARMTSRLLTRQGHALMAAHDGFEGIEAAKAFEPDVILLDIGLPGLNGYEVAAEIRDHACCRDSIIVAVSGYGEFAARERSRIVGIDHHLTKPLDFDELDAIFRGPRPGAGVDR